MNCTIANTKPGLHRSYFQNEPRSNSALKKYDWEPEEHNNVSYIFLTNVKFLTGKPGTSVVIYIGCI